jgi:uncharacterized protein (DUF2235 family)
MALYAFDGTWNVDEVDEAKDSNVVRFREAYTNQVFYLEGVGTRKGFIDKILGAYTGAGAKIRLVEAMTQLNRNFEDGDHIVDIIGFSRGAATALHFANDIQKDKDRAEIRFLGLWDVVASFGIPGNDNNPGWTLTLPNNVRNCYHAMALDESRGAFPLTRVRAAADGLPTSGRLQEVWFRGVHSDVGGSSPSGLRSIALCWMLRRAVETGLPIAEAMIKQYEALCDANAPYKKSWDPKPDKARGVDQGDAVHETVRLFSRAGQTKPNPPWERNDPPEPPYVVIARG